MAAYNAAADRLRILAPRKGVRVPPMIELGGWFSVPATVHTPVPTPVPASVSTSASAVLGVSCNNSNNDNNSNNNNDNNSGDGDDGDGGDGGFLSQSLGDAKVGVSVCVRARVGVGLRVGVGV